MDTGNTGNGIWGVAAHSRGPVTNFASILKEEEDGKRAETAMHSEMMDEEDQALLLAIERSKNDVEHSAVNYEDEDEYLQQALRLSLIEATAVNSEEKIDPSVESDSALLQSDGVSNGESLISPGATADINAHLSSALSDQEISLEDQLAIQKALLEADEVEHKKSLELAIRLAQEEQEKETVLARQRQDACTGNVRIKTRAEVQAEMDAWPLRKNTPRLVEDETQEQDPGFRMNTAGRLEWARQNQSSVIGPDNEIRTKHDVELNGLSNAHRLGLDHRYDDDVIVGNRAYNSFMSSLKKSSTNKGVAAHGTGRANSDADTTKRGMDPSVRLCITHAINNGVIEHLNGIVKEGKEAVIHHADGVETSTSDVAVKIFKKIQEFRARGDYVDGDPRYRRESFRKASPHEQLALWAEKEYRNIVRAERAGVPVPSPLLVKENILFMQFIGEDGWPAPQLRELDLRRGSSRWSTLYEQVVTALQR
jgi:hypothetical protein